MHVESRYSEGGRRVEFKNWFRNVREISEI